MKNKIINIITAPLLITVLAYSCSPSFLNLSDPTTKDSENFYQNQEQVEQAVNGAYSQLQSITNSQYLFAEMTSDNTTMQLNASDRGQVDRAEAFEFWNVTATNVNLAGFYSQAYNALFNINTVLVKLAETSIEEDKKRQYLGELLFLRAYNYFLLTQYFGDVVLVTSPLENASEAFDLSRAPAAEVYQQIIADLETAVTELPLKTAYNAANIGRASKGAALSLLGKVHLTLRSYDKAKETLEQVLSMNYSLLSDYAQVFEPTNKNHAESIFEVQYQGGNNLGEWSNFIYIFAPRDSEGAVVGFPTARPQGWNIPTNDMIAAYETGDKRKDISLKEGYTNAAGQFIAIPYVNKYNHPHTIVNRTDDNWPILRYADVLLMLSEAINEEFGPDEAYQYVNQVRARAGLDPLTGLNQVTFRKAIAHERRVELAFENHRWFDLKRTLTSEELVQLLNTHGAQERENPTVTRGGVPFAAADYRFEAFEALFPIPDRQIFLSKNLTQNDGY